MGFSHFDPVSPERKSDVEFIEVEDLCTNF